MYKSVSISHGAELTRAFLPQSVELGGVASSFEGDLLVVSHPDGLKWVGSSCSALHFSA